jgi:flagellar protein FliO/FliZ
VPWLFAVAALAARPGAAAQSDVPLRASVEPGLPSGYIAEYLLGVVLVLLLLGVMAWLARRMQRHVPGSHGGLRLEASMPLGAKERLAIVEVEGERLLLGIGAGGVRALTQLPPRAGEPRDAAPTGSWLQRTLRREAR